MFIFLYGANTYSSTEKLKQIKAKFQKEIDPSGLNIVNLAGENLALEKFNNAACQSGFLVTKRLIITKNLLLSEPAKELTEPLLELLKRFKNSDNIFVFWEGGLPDQRTALFKLLNREKKYAQNFASLDNPQLNSWIKNYLKENGGKMANPALWLLTSAVGNDLWQIKNELDKLLAYRPGLEIKEADVKEIVTAKITENIFGLTEAIALNNKVTSLKLLQDQLAAGLNENYLLTMIVRQFRLLVQLKPWLTENYQEKKIVAATKLHPFVVKKTLPLAKKFSWEKIKKIYQDLVDLDKTFKSTALPPKILLSLLIMKI